MGGLSPVERFFLVAYTLYLLECVQSEPRSNTRVSSHQYVFISKIILQLIPDPGIPYLKFLKKESYDGEVGQAEFARMQREALENYLIGVIRAVVR